MTNNFIVRSVTFNDLPALKNLEHEVWGKQGLKNMLSLDELKTLFNTNSPLFLVAEENGEIAAYFYAQFIDFSPDDLDNFITPQKFLSTGLTTHQHNPDGNSVYGVSVISHTRGAGKILRNEIYKQVKNLKKRFYFGYSRLPGFTNYLEKLNIKDVEHYGEDVIALWYAYESIKMIKGNIWESCAPQPQLNIPLPEKPDPVLSFHTKNTDCGLLQVLPEFMPDPASRNYVALIAFEIEN